MDYTLIKFYALNKIFYDFYESSKNVLDKNIHINEEEFKKLNEKNIDKYIIALYDILDENIENKDKIYEAYLGLKTKEINSDKIKVLIAKIKNILNNNKGLNKFIQGELTNYINDNFQIFINIITNMEKREQDIEKAFQKRKFNLKKEINNQRRKIVSLENKIESGENALKELVINFDEEKKRITSLIENKYQRILFSIHQNEKNLIELHEKKINELKEHYTKKENEMLKKHEEYKKEVLNQHEMKEKEFEKQKKIIEKQHEQHEMKEKQLEKQKKMIEEQHELKEKELEKQKKIFEEQYKIKEKELEKQKKIFEEQYEKKMEIMINQHELKEKKFEEQMKLMVKQHQIKEQDLQKKYELKEKNLIKEKEKIIDDKIELMKKLSQNNEIFDFYAQKIEEIGTMKTKIEKLELELKKKENEILLYKNFFDN